MRFLVLGAHFAGNRLPGNSITDAGIYRFGNRLLIDSVSFRVPFRFRVNYVSENTSAHNAHQKPTDNTRTDADLLRARAEATHDD
jgi:hypothetical protein